MNRIDYHSLRRQAYLLRERIKNFMQHVQMADSRTCRQIGDDGDTLLRLQHKLNIVDAMIRPTGRDRLRSNYLTSKHKVLFDLRARAGRQNNAERFGCYHDMMKSITKELRHG